ncbi:MAG: family 10 glycosylhydrolase [Candidatus Bathyarchaeia archaeon]
MLIGFLSLCLAFSPLMKSVTIRSGGTILTRVLFDKCDQNSEWKIYSSRDAGAPGYNTIEVDTNDKVEGTGSLKGTFAADAPNYGGQFYKSNGSFWDLTNTPLLRMWIKINQTMYSAFKFEIVCDYSWDTFGYEILDQLVVGNWREVVVDLRLPDYKPWGKIPDLTKVHRLCLTYWYGYSINDPQVIWWDNITLWTGPYITPQVAITPLSKVVMINEIASFSTRILGGKAPFSYKWWINGTLQQGQSSTFNLSRSTAGKYNVTIVVTDNQGNSGFATAWVTVLESPPPQPPIPTSFNYFKSEVRGVAVGYVWGQNTNFSLIAQTLYDYGINTAYVDVSKLYLTGFDRVWRGTLNNLPYHRLFIDECHKRGIRVVASLVTMYEAPTSPDMRTLTSTGYLDWLDVTKPEAREMLKAIVETLAKDYDFDGINIDYYRWEYRTDMPLGNEARDKFIADTGLSDVNWPTDVLYGGRYFWQFMNWRANVITELVGDMYRWAKEANPDIVVSICPWEALDAKWYWVYYIGQHNADIIDKGHCDIVSPMCYDPNASRVIQEVQWAYDLYVGKVEGKYPLIPFLSHSYFTPEQFANLMAQLKAIGIDGWVLLLYNGPGAEYMPAEYRETYPDIRPYLAALHEAGLMEPIWAIQNFTVSVSGNTATISWTTTVPTNATIEYSDGKIFYAATSLYQNALYYKDINYNETDSIKIYNSTYSTTHNFMIPVSDTTCFRIICTDENGNATVTSRPIQISEIQR